MMEFNENAVLIKLHTGFKSETHGQLPLTCYETTRVDTENSVPPAGTSDPESSTLNLRFVMASASITTGGADRIAVVELARSLDSEGEEGASLLAQLTAQKNAVSMLRTRLKDVLDAMQSGSGVSRQTMREISSMLTRYPIALPGTMNHSSTDEQDAVEVLQQDTMLLNYLGQMVQGLNELDGTWTKVSEGLPARTVDDELVGGGIGMGMSTEMMMRGSRREMGGGEMGKKLGKQPMRAFK